MDTTGGTYTLLIEVEEPIERAIGALGTRTLDPGWYAYVGSALGSGGFSRIDRHRELARGERETRHWHIDYLLGHHGSRLADVVTTEGEAIECGVASELDVGEQSVIAGFGCSDCRCRSHLFYRQRETALRSAVEAAHERFRTEQ